MLLVQKRSTGSSVPFRARFTHIHTHTHCNKWHIDTVTSGKTESIIIGAVSCLQPFSKSIREHHTLRKSSAYAADSTRNDSSVQKAQRASDEQSASAWQHYLCYIFASVCVALLAAGEMSRQSPAFSCLARKSSVSLRPVSSSIGAHLGQNTHTSPTHTHCLASAPNKLQLEVTVRILKSYFLFFSLIGTVVFSWTSVGSGCLSDLLSSQPTLD